MDYFEEKGAGYQYVNLRNDAGAGTLFIRPSYLCINKQ